MRKVIILLTAALFLALPLEANATLQCVTYARDVTGVNIKGDAWKWWEAAAGLYERGKAPRVGSVLVFKRQGKMSHGHVSVVRGTAGSRVVLVDHANWAPHRSAGRGQITKAVPVMDVSPNNDWSEVRVWYQPARDFGGHVYKTQGFVYVPGSKAVIAASLHVDAPHAAPAVSHAEQVVAAVKAEAPVKAEAKAEAAVLPARKAEPAAVAQPQAQPAVVEAKANVPTAEPVAANVIGKFDASRWAEQS